MKLQEAMEFVNKEKIGTQEQQLTAFTTMFKEMYGVNVKNDDGTYKSLYTVLEEASSKIS